MAFCPLQVTVTKQTTICDRMYFQKWNTKVVANDFMFLRELEHAGSFQ